MENENNQRKKLVEKEIFPFLAKKTNLPHRPMPRSFKTNGMCLGEERPVSLKGTGHYDFPYRYLFLFLTIL